MTVIVGLEQLWWRGMVEMVGVWIDGGADENGRASSEEDRGYGGGGGGDLMVAGAGLGKEGVGPFSPPTAHDLSFFPAEYYILILLQFLLPLRLSSFNFAGKQKQEPKYEWETKRTPKKPKESSPEEEVKGRVELLSEANLNPMKVVSARKKTLIIDNLAPRTQVSDIVVSVRRFVNHKGGKLSFSSVEFASANEVEKVQEMKNGEYLHDKRITLGLAKITPYPQRPK
ncbi:unnamed protein product [Cuscuta campestris]|uniref:RRM domain-containing protein n=1 Tax=Cuscuta campestris TaxID=132261 RepID=A0A484NFR2_9ASTE|nr:unnamed protein product [Cuscuta campestris]